MESVGKVGHVGRREVRRGDRELLGKFIELDGTGWGDVGRREVELGDGEVLGRSVELDGVGRSLEVNKELGRVESMSTTDDGGVGGENEKTFYTNLTWQDTKIFLIVGSK